MNAQMQFLSAQNRYFDLVSKAVAFRKQDVSLVEQFRLELELAIASRELREITEFARDLNMTVF